MRTFLPGVRAPWLHLVFWGLYAALCFYPFRQQPQLWQQVWPGIMAALILNALLAYANYMYLLPRFLRTRRTLEYLLLFSGAYVAMVALRVAANRQLMFTAVDLKYLHSSEHTWTVAVGLLFNVLIVALLFFATHWFVLVDRTKALKNENQNAELRYLKAQLNPHFLFNTLNNLYYLAYSRSERTPDVVAMLAQMMRYMLEEANRPVVELSHEIEHLSNYIQLEKLRLNHPIPITLTVEGQPNGLAVAPLIFMAFLENAFKHGITTTSNTAWVRVHFDLTGAGCCFSVANSKLPGPLPRVGPAGTGLPNVRRRLALSYPNRHDLRIEDLPDEYRVTLRLTL